MRVAHIRTPKGADYIEAIFLESARFFRLLKSNPRYDRTLGLLQSSMATGAFLKVRVAAAGSDVIEDVEA